MCILILCVPSVFTSTDLSKEEMLENSQFMVTMLRILNIFKTEPGFILKASDFFSQLRQSSLNTGTGC